MCIAFAVAVFDLEGTFEVSICSSELLSWLTSVELRVHSLLMICCPSVLQVRSDEVDLHDIGQDAEFSDILVFILSDV